MASRRTQRSFATFMSVLAHVMLVVLLIYGVPLDSSNNAAMSDGDPVSTVMVSAETVLAELARLDSSEQDQLRADQEAIEQARREAEAEEQAIAKVLNKEWVLK